MVVWGDFWVRKTCWLVGDGLRLGVSFFHALKSIQNAGVYGGSGAESVFYMTESSVCKALKRMALLQSVNQNLVKATRCCINKGRS